MTRASDDMNDLVSDIHHLSTLISVITNLAINIDLDPQQLERAQKDVNEVSDLLWIAREMAETIAENSEAAHSRVVADRNAAHQQMKTEARNAGGAI